VSSPRTNEKRKLALNASSSFRETLKKIKRKRSKQDIRSRRIIAHAIRLKGTDGMKSVGISRKLSKRLEKSNKSGWEEDRKRRKDALTEEKQEEITTLYENASKEIPDTRGRQSRWRFSEQKDNEINL
jgi:hypothetical protein